jgi:hypothetical protein
MKFTANCGIERSITLKNGVFWDDTPCGFCKNRRFELSASFIRVTRIGELGTTLAVTSNRHTLRRNTAANVCIYFAEIQVPLKSGRILTGRDYDQIPDDGIFPWMENNVLYLMS